MSRDVALPHRACRLLCQAVCGLLCLASAAWGQTVAPAGPPAWNLHLVATEDFLNRFIARQEAIPGPVNEFVFDMRVEGEQCTYTDLKIDLRPATGIASAQFVLRGDVQSRTMGHSDQAVVHTLGLAKFRAVKDVYFDGEKFSTRSPTISVQADNQNLGIQTRLDGTPLGGLASMMAAKVAEQRKPATTELARQRVMERVLPPFDAGIDQILAEANDRLESVVRTKLRQYDLLPAAQQVVTTDRHLHFAAVLGRVTAAPSPPRPSLVAPHAANLYVHQSVLNGLLDRLKLHGYKTTDRELRSLRNRFKGATGEPPESASPFHGVSFNFNLDTEIEFDSERPLAVELQDDRLVLKVRATLRPAGQALMPPVELSIPLRLSPDGKTWRLSTEPVNIRSLRDGERIPDVVATLVREAIGSSLPTQEFPAELPIPDWPADKPRLKLAAVHAADGWVAISLD